MEVRQQTTLTNLTDSPNENNLLMSNEFGPNGAPGTRSQPTSARGERSGHDRFVPPASGMPHSSAREAGVGSDPFQ
jgi:hypothetical protein